MSIKIKSAIFITTLLFPVFNIPAATIYVDDSHTGTESGTEEEPYNTIKEALYSLPANPVQSYVVLIAPGNYPEEQIELKNSSRVWASDKNLTIKAGYESIFMAWKRQLWKSNVIGTLYISNYFRQVC
ncbi:MAG: hypothetical protein ABIA63_02920 [bacterium]